MPLPLRLGHCRAGEWYLEFFRFFTGSDVQAMANAAGRTLHLPHDFSARRELLRDTDRSFCKCVRGVPFPARGACACARVLDDAATYLCT